MLEIEMKFAVGDFRAIEERLRAAGATLVVEQTEADHYFNAPDRDFRQTDEAFRIRRIGARSLITYKGPRAAGPTKTRLEIEVPLADGQEPFADMDRLLRQLGYRAVAIVRKNRRIFQIDRNGAETHVSLDDVEGVGKYAEVEVVADDAQAEAAKERVQQVAAELGLGNSERRSYLALLLERGS